MHRKCRHHKRARSAAEPPQAQRAHLEAPLAPGRGRGRVRQLVQARVAGAQRLEVAPRRADPQQKPVSRWSVPDLSVKWYATQRSKTAVSPCALLHGAGARRDGQVPRDRREHRDAAVAWQCGQLRRSASPQRSFGPRVQNLPQRPFGQRVPRKSRKLQRGSHEFLRSKSVCSAVLNRSVCHVLSRGTGSESRSPRPAPPRRRSRSRYPSASSPGGAPLELKKAQAERSAQPNSGVQG